MRSSRLIPDSDGLAARGSAPENERPSPEMPDLERPSGSPFMPAGFSASSWRIAPFICA